jgi:hypothetical protein
MQYDGMGTTCSTNVDEGELVQFWLENIKEKDWLEYIRHRWEDINICLRERKSTPVTAWIIFT